MTIISAPVQLNGEGDVVGLHGRHTLFFGVFRRTAAAAHDAYLVDMDADAGDIKVRDPGTAQAIVSLLTANDGIPPERIKIQPSESIEEGDKISATLGLDAM